MTTLDASRASPAGAIAIAATVAAVVIGALVAVSPLVGFIAFLIAFAIWMLSYGQRMVPIFHIGLLFILVVYAFLGRGGAYLGVAPVFIGEVVLVVGVLAILVSLPTARLHVFHLALIPFMAWGAYRTLPYVAPYGVDAFRDGVSWGYALFAIAVSVTVRKEHVDALMRLYARFIPWFIVWVPVAAVLFIVANDALPRVPGSDEPIVVFKGGDVGVHIGAIGAFMVLGLGGTNLAAVRDWAIWAGWLLAVGLAGAINRGGMLAAAMMTTSVLFARATTRWFSLVFVGAFLFAVVGLVNPEVDLGLARKLSFDQVVNNVVSVVAGEKDDPILEGTKTWRLRWWGKIVDYTVDGPYFWQGKGFGINLADEDGFQVNADGSLRAPHSGHLELLARGGVPMFVLWLLVNAVFAATILRAALRARAASLDRWVRVTGWIFVYWLAALVNASFDVYLQGPMGGIWFWSVIGLGIAVAGIIDREVAEQRSQGSVAAVAPTPRT